MAKSEPKFFEFTIPTDEGDFFTAYSERGLAGLHFPRNGISKAASDSKNVPPQVLGWHEITTRALHRALAGKGPEELPPLDLSAGTLFQQRVWNALRQIQVGETRSYGEVARVIGNSAAVRAVGGACGANPIAVLIPCHRVLAANLRLGGFSAAMKWKRALLEREGAAVRD
jgi:O-6-methylguanine DNA methyltransferase